MTTKTDYAFIALNVISWIIFIGLCVEAGAIIFNAFFTLFYNPFGTGKLWDVKNLAELYNYNQSWYVTIISLMIITAVLVIVLSDKKPETAEEAVAGAESAGPGAAEAAIEEIEA